MDTVGKFHILNLRMKCVNLPCLPVNQILQLQRFKVSKYRTPKLTNNLPRKQDITKHGINHRSLPFLLSHKAFSGVENMFMIYLT